MNNATNEQKAAAIAAAFALKGWNIEQAARHMEMKPYNLKRLIGGKFKITPEQIEKALLALIQ